METKSYDIEKSVRPFWWSHEATHMYTLLDTARDEIIYSSLLTSGVEHKCLYRGEKALDLAEVAPYIATLSPNTLFTQWLLKNGWGMSYGIFVESSASLNQLKRHFQQFIMVYDEEGTPLYFRYYDPRVFRVYLPTCNKDELKMIFGPVNRFFAENEDRKSMVEYTLADGELIQRDIRLTG